jgi:hypothetical protein
VLAKMLGCTHGQRQGQRTRVGDKKLRCTRVEVPESRVGGAKNLGKMLGCSHGH